MLDSRKLFVYNSTGDDYYFSNSLMGRTTSWNPGICYEFMNNLKMIKSDQLNTLYKLTNWMRAHLIHISGSTEYIDQYGYAGMPPPDRMIYPLEGKKHISAGCWGTSGFYAAMLRGVNIPVEHARTAFGESNANHSRPYFPSVDRSMPHADDVYTGVLRCSGMVIPVSELFYTSAEMTSMFISPTLDCDGSDCNTVGEQASYNSGKDHIATSWSIRADYLLYEYARNGEEHTRGSLRGPRIGGSVNEYAKPYYTEAEINTIITEIVAHLTTQGDGDLEAGKARVMARVSKWNGNK